MKYFEMYKFIYNNWLDDARVPSVASMKWFTEMEEALINENEDVIIKLGLLKLEDNCVKL
jgi:hypothetical protein